MEVLREADRIELLGRPDRVSILVLMEVLREAAKFGARCFTVTGVSILVLMEVLREVGLGGG